MDRQKVRLITYVLAAGLVFLSSGIAQNPSKFWKQYATPEEAGFSSEKLKAVVDLYEENRATALMVVYDGNVLLARGDILRRYDTHSMRKSLISALYGIYSERGSIDIHKTLKEIGIDDSVRLTDMERSATIQDLLKARSGIYIPAFGESKSMTTSRPARGSHPPNTFYYYNNWDSNVLGAIFQNETGTNLFEAFDESLAKPLEMEDFRPIDGRFWRDTTLQTIFPKYDIKMSTRDLARVGTLYCNGGVWSGRQILSKNWISESFTPYSTTDYGSYRESYGYLWWIQVLDDSIPMYSALGWGGHIVAVVPAYNLVLVRRHDTYAGFGRDASGETYVRAVIAARTSAPAASPKLAPLEVKSIERQFLPMSEDDLKKYEQEFFMNGRTRNIRYGKYGLVFDDWYVLRPISETRFYVDDLQKYAYFKIQDKKPVFEKIGE